MSDLYTEIQELEHEVIQTAITAHCHREDSDAQESHREAVSKLIEARYQSIKQVSITNQTKDAGVRG